MSCPGINAGSYQRYTESGYDNKNKVMKQVIFSFEKCNVQAIPSAFAISTNASATYDACSFVMP